MGSIVGREVAIGKVSPTAGVRDATTMMSDPLITHEEARRAAQRVLDHPATDGVEVVVGASTSGVTRYATSEIIQNTVRNEVAVTVRVAVGDRLASASTNQLDEPHMRAAVDRAVVAARASRPDEEWPGFANPDTVGRPERRAGPWDENTAAASPAARARAVTRILDAADSDNAAGVYETSSHAYGVFSSLGVDCYDGYTRCVTTCLVDNGESTGWGDASSYALSEVDVEGAARRAVAKAEQSRGPTEWQPGVYEVVLEAPAVATLLDYLSYAGFGSKSVIEKESFLARRSGEVVGSPDITVADDVWHPRSVGIGFDFEGVPKKRVAVIDHGRATGPVTDLRGAKVLSLEATGHGSGSNEFGAYAANVVFDSGDQSTDELVAGIEDGLLVTRFHYVNILDQATTLLTGMTRDGTFRIKGGAIVGAVHNLRFAQSVIDGLATVDGIGRDPVSFAPEFGSFGSTVAPALRMREFRFVSTTSH